MYICPICADVVADDEFLRGRHIYVVPRLELAVSHMVFLHVHERSVMVGLAVAVSFSADVQILCVFLPLLQPAVHRFYSSL